MSAGRPACATFRSLLIRMLAYNDSNKLAAQDVTSRLRKAKPCHNAPLLRMFSKELWGRCVL